MVPALSIFSTKRQNKWIGDGRSSSSMYISGSAFGFNRIQDEE